MSTGRSSIGGSIRVMTVDDHPLFRQGIATLIDADDDIELVAEASDGEHAIAQILPTPIRCDLDGYSNAQYEWYRVHKPNQAGIPYAKILVPRPLRAMFESYGRSKRVRGKYPAVRICSRRTAACYSHRARWRKARIPPEIAAELAEHAGDDQLSSREIDVLRLIGAGNANKLIRGQALHRRNDGQEPHLAHPLPSWRVLTTGAYARNHCPTARDHRARGAPNKHSKTQAGTLSMSFQNH